MNTCRQWIILKMALHHFIVWHDRYLCTNCYGNDGNDDGVDDGQTPSTVCHCYKALFPEYQNLSLRTFRVDKFLLELFEIYVIVLLIKSTFRTFFRG